MSDPDWTKATDDDLYDAVDEGEPEAIAEAASREYVQCRKERDEARAESTRLRTALERIAQYEMNWAAGPSENLNNVQAIAEAALTPTTGGAPGDVGLDKLRAMIEDAHWDETGDGSPVAVYSADEINEMRAILRAANPPPPPDTAPVHPSWCGKPSTMAPNERAYCAPACRDAGRPLNPAPDPLKPMTEEQRRNFVPISDEAISEAIRKGAEARDLAMNPWKQASPEKGTALDPRCPNCGCAMLPDGCVNCHTGTTREP